MTIRLADRSATATGRIRLVARNTRRHVVYNRRFGRDHLRDGAVLTHSVRNLPAGRLVAAFYMHDSNGHTVKRDLSIRVIR